MCLNLCGDHTIIIHLSFLIFVPSELMSAKSKNLILMNNNNNNNNKNNRIYLIKITAQQRSPYVQSYF